MKTQNFWSDVEYALSIAKENINKDGSIATPDNASIENITSFLAQKALSPNKSLAELAKSPDCAKGMQDYISFGVNLFHNIAEQMEQSNALASEDNPFVAELDKWITEFGDAEEMLDCIPQSPRRKPTTFSDFINNPAETEAVIAAITNVMTGKHGKSAIIVITSAIELGLISRPTYSSVKEIFPQVGSKSNFYNCLINFFTPNEIAPIKVALSDELSAILSENA